MAEYIFPKNSKPSFFSRIKSYFSNDAGGVVFVDRSSSAPTRGSKEIIECYHASPYLRATVSKIAQHVACVPWGLYRIGNEKAEKALLRKLKTSPLATRRELKRNLKKNVESSSGSSGEYVELDTHPLLSLWDKPNPFFSGNRLRSLTQKYLDLVGEFFWVIERDNRGMPVELWPVPPTWVKAIPNSANGSYEIRWGNEKRFVPREDMIWFFDDNLINPYGRGAGTGHALADELDSDEYAAQLIKTAFENRGLLDVVISVEGAKQDQLDRARTEFENRHRGWLKAGVPFFHSGKADVKTVSQSFSEMQLLELREWERDTVISIYGVPPELIGVLGNSNRATISEARDIMASEVVIPRLDYICSVLNNTLVPQFGANLYLEFDDPTPGRDEVKLKALTAFPYVATVREVRSLIGLEDRGEVDEYVLIPPGLYPFRGRVGVDDGEDSREDVDESNETTESSSDLPAGGETMEGDSKSAKASAQVETKELKSSVVLEALRAVTAIPFIENVLPLWTEQLVKSTQEDLNELENEKGEDSKNLVTRANTTQLIAAHLKDFAGSRINDINKTTRKQLRATLAEGVENGESPAKLRKRVLEVFDVSKGRASVIARTEVQRSSNFATNTALVTSGIVTDKEWISTLDNATRDSHADMNGSTVSIDEKFTLKSGNNAGAEADHPGDFSIAEEDIQCRCTHWGVTPKIRNLEAHHKTEYLASRWKAYDARASEWESKALPLILESFEAQMQDVLKALGE
jgi:HK97 family phage portal protein